MRETPLHRLAPARRPAPLLREARSAARHALGAAGGVATGAVLAAVSALRRAKPVHPHGESFLATFSVAPEPSAPSAARLLSMPGEHRAVARFSRSLGLPRPLPDLLGMSIRVLDAYGRGSHQDLLLVTAGHHPLLHHVFLPAVDTQQRPYTSALPYRIGGRLFVVGALPDPRSPRPAGEDEFARLRAAAATGELRFRIALAPVGRRFRPVAELRIGAPLPGTLEGLRYSPWNTGGGLQPAGVLNQMRRYAYPMSQWTWRRALRGGRALQGAADRAVAQITAPAVEDGESGGASSARHAG
jgi:hypothetical protein